MRVAFAIVGVVVGLVAGALGGFRAGKSAEGVASKYWTYNALAFIGGLGLDIVGVYAHQTWLSYGALGLMAGLITGLKYGFLPDLRMWETPVAPPVTPDEGEAEDATEDAAADTDAPKG